MYSGKYNILDYCFRNKSFTFNKLLSFLNEKIAELYPGEGLAIKTPSKIEIGKMQNRWGSCSTKGKILLNPELIKAPKVCIEYVIVHELCQLVHRDHTKAFFDIQQTEFPEWKKWKNKLEVLLA